MSLTREDVLHIARLARLRVSAQEIENMQAQLSSIFNLIKTMQAVDTEGIEPMSHALDITQRLREDTITESDLRNKFQTIAPAVENGLYLVPKVIES